MAVVLAFLVAAAIGFLCARTAAGKGRSPLGYGLLGFFLPLIGLIVVAVVPRRDAATS